MFHWNNFLRYVGSSVSSSDVAVISDTRGWYASAVRDDQKDGVHGKKVARAPVPLPILSRAGR